MFSSIFIRLFLLIGISALNCSAYKILVFSPTLSRSHMISNGRVADALASDGHAVTLVEIQYAVPLDILNVTKLANVWHIPGQFFRAEIDGKPFTKIIADNAFEADSIIASFFMSKAFQYTLNDACEAFFTTQSQQLALLKEQKFDVIISEQLNFCGAGVGHLLNIPINIILCSTSLQEHVTSLIGLPFPSSYVPSLMDSNVPDKMSLVQRFQNLMRQFVGYNYNYYGTDPLTQIFQKHFGIDFPDLRSIVNRSPFIFVAADEFVDFPRPIFPNVIYIGGLGMEKSHGEQKQITLKEPFLREMTKGVDGVVFFSMGSIMRSTEMPESFRRHIIEAFSQFTNYHFIVKVEKEDTYIANLTLHLDNVFLTSWAPQSELLNHPRLRLFITHGGYNSLLEAANAGVPVLLMGFFADQYRNARVAERNGWGLAVDKRLLLESSDQFGRAIRTVLDDPSFGANAKRTKKLLSTKPFTAKERLLKNIRFLEMNGGELPELLSESRNMSAVQLYNLDLAMLATLALLTLLIILRYLAKFALASAILAKSLRMKTKKNKEE
uniref:glucuronosyltransferase n=1 Tax=Globodera rostochiensis TaxID=31243 RepID=A0A914H1V3_GLORO